MFSDLIVFFLQEHVEKYSLWQFWLYKYADLDHPLFLQKLIYQVKLFLKQGISRQLGRGWMQLFDLNARIQQLMWSLIFYEKYSTSQSVL